MRYAILLACEEYDHFPTVFYAYADAEEMISTLTGFCDYALENIHYIQLYPGCGESVSSIFQSFKSMFSKITKEDTLLFYYAGHGYKSGDKGYLLLPESTFDDFPGTAIDIKALNDAFRETECNCFLILDACHSGIQARSAIQLESLLETIPKDTGCVTLASCSANELSYPDPSLEHGVFTYFLCEEIKKTKKRQQCFPEILKLSVCRAVKAWATKNGTVQTPTLLGQVIGNISIATRSDTEYDNTEEILQDETLALFEDVTKAWLHTRYNITMLKPVRINKDWRVFGRLRILEAVPEGGGEPWLVLFSIAEKFNHANLLHSFSNLHEIRNYYARFGLESKYKYLQLIILKNKEACHMVERPLAKDTSVRRYWNNSNVNNIILYLNHGKLIEYKNNSSMQNK